MKKNLLSLDFSTNDSLLTRLNSYHCYFRIHTLNLLFYQCAQYAIYFYNNEIDCSIPFIWCYSCDRELSWNMTYHIFTVLDLQIQPKNWSKFLTHLSRKKKKFACVFYLANIAFDCVDSLLSAPLIWPSYKDHLKNVQQKLTHHVYTSWWHRRFFNIWKFYKVYYTWNIKMALNL